MGKGQERPSPGLCNKAHSTVKLKMLKHLTIKLLPPKSPELNPGENIWQ